MIVREKYSNSMVIYLYGLLVFLIYICLINNSMGYEWDASNIARWADEGLYIAPRQQNHILQSFLGRIWFDIWRFFGYQKPALMPLRVLSCIFGAVGVVAFYVLLRRVFQENKTALFGSLGLAFSTYYWAYSTDLETHLLPSAVFIFCLILLFNLDNQLSISKSKIILLGLVHSLCIYLSGIYIFFVPAIVIGIITIRNKCINRCNVLATYFISLIVFWLIPFFLIGAYCYFNPEFSLRLKYSNSFLTHIFLWFRGVENLINFKWVNIFVCYTEIISYLNNLPKVFKIITYVFYSLFILSALIKIKELLRVFWRVLLIALCIVIPYQIIILVFEPENFQRYTHFLSSLWLILSCMAYPFLITKSKLFKILPFLFIAFIFYVNLVYYIYPRHKVTLGSVRESWVKDLCSEYEYLFQAGQYENALLSIRHVTMIYIETYGHQVSVIPYLEKEVVLLDKIGKKNEAQGVKSFIKDMRLGKIK